MATAKPSVKKPAAKKAAPVAAKKAASQSAGTDSAALPKELFGGEVNKPLMAQAVRVYLANQREGSAQVKTRGEVEGSTRKIYRQKGTGKARHGSIRAPIFVGGGIVFGPDVRDYSRKMSKAMKRVALLSALAAKKNDVKVVSALDSVEAKTKAVAKILMDTCGKGSTLLVVSKDANNLKRAARNIKGLEFVSADNLHPYAVLAHKHVVFTKVSLEDAKKQFSKNA